MKLYKSTEKSFLDNGFGNIQAISCLETKKKSLNGWYIECKFPIKYIDVLKQDRILYVETKEKGGQAFRINNIKCTDRYIELTANHVVFDAERYLLDDVRPTDLNPTSFLKWCNERTDTVSPFSVSSNVNGVGTRYFVRKSLLECFSDAESLFGGVFDANNFDVRLLQKVGNNNGYSIIYGKNLQSVSIVEDWSSVVTKLLPVGPNGITLTEKYLQSDIQYEKPYTKTVTFDVPTNYKQGDSTIDHTPEEIKSFLKQKALEYLEQNKIPKINYTVASDVPQELCIGDTITIKHPLVEIKTEVQSYQYDVIAKRVKKLEFGNYDKSVKKIFDSIKETIKKNEAALQEQNNVIQQQSDLINKLNKDGYVYIDENEILILDTLPKEKAKNVWRFGLGGIGFSSNGINGPFESALTQDGTFNTNFIKANSITVNHLSSDVGSSLDLTTNKTTKANTKEMYDLICGKGNIFTNCERVIERKLDDAHKQINDMPLIVDINDLRNQYCVISTNIEVKNATFTNVNEGIGAKFTVNYADNTSEVIKTEWLPIQNALQTELGKNDNNVKTRIATIYKLQDKAISSISNLTLFNKVKADFSLVKYPKVEFGTTPTGFDFDKYTLEERIQSTEIKLTPEQIVLAVNDNLNKNGVIETVKFILDKFGVVIKGGGLSIMNNNNEKVLDADVVGNLIIKYLHAIDGTFEGTIKASNIEGSTINGSSFMAKKQRVADIYTGDDTKIRDFITGKTTLTNEEKERLDFNCDGELTPSDYVIATKMLNGSLGKEWRDYIRIETNELGKYRVIIGTQNLLDTTSKYETIVSSGFCSVDNLRSKDAEITTLTTTRINPQKGTNVITIGGNLDMTNNQILNQSDKRYKENIIDVDLSSLIDNAKVKEFNYIDQSNKSVGVIAQDFEQNSNAQYFMQKDENDKYVVNYHVLNMALIQKVQQLEKRIEQLEKGVVL